MKYSEFIKMMDNGLQPVIEFTKEIEESDYEPNAGMRCKVISYNDCKDGTALLTCNFNEFRKYNKSFAEANFYDKNDKPTLKWFDTVYYPVDGIYSYYVDTTDKYELLFNIVEMSNYYKQYIGSKSELNYINWLEKRIENLESEIRSI